MIIDRIELVWFRGAATRVSLETESRSVALYGANGAGKSCFVDAIEYTLNNGRIGHLAHEYSGRHQEKAILNTHRPKDAQASVAICLKDESEATMTIAPSGSFELAESGDTVFTDLECARTVLRQDEVSHFVHSTKGEKYSVLLPLLGLSHLETAAENFRQLAREVRKQSGSNEAAASLRTADTQLARAHGEGTAPDANDVIRKLCDTFVTECHEHEAKVCSELVEVSLDRRLRDSSAQERQQMALEQLGMIDLHSAISDVRGAATDLAQSADQAVQSQLTALRGAQSFLDHSERGEKILCPACGTEFPRSELKRHVAAELARLEGVEEDVANYRAQVQALRGKASQVVAACKSQEIQEWVAASSDARIEDIVSAAAATEIPSGELDDSQLSALQDTLGAAVVAGASAASFLPPPVTDLAAAKERLHAAGAVIDARSRVAAASAGENLATEIEALEASVREDIGLRSKAVIAEISADIQRMWSILHPGEPIENVRLHVPDESDKAIDIALKFYGKELTSPRLTLSEGYRNSLGLCVFLAMAARYGDGSTPVVLDDVIVSLDRGHRGMVVDLLQKEFTGRQILLFTHDRDWYVDLRQQLSGKEWRFRSLLPYRDPTEGIRWADRAGTFDDARAYVQTRPDTAANEARKTMDIELSVIAERLELELPYARGARNDKRTAHEFLQQLVSKGKGSFQSGGPKDYKSHTDALSALEVADKLMMTWANRGSHSEDVTESEATRLIDVCEEALGFLTCSFCDKPVSFAETKSGHRQCQCGFLRWK